MSDQMEAPKDGASRIEKIFSKVDKPTIQIREGHLHDMATEAEKALIDADVQFYQRSGVGLVRPIVDDAMASNGSKVKVARLKRVDSDCMIDHLSRTAHWVKWDARKNDLAVRNPPKDAAAIILSRDGSWRFRRLAGVITTPTLRPDGTVLSKPGYDEATQLLLVKPPRLPAMPDKPSRDDALQALRILGDLLEDFPFVDGPSKSAAISALITPVVRGAMHVAPMHAVTAPTAGSGKSYIIDLVGAISSGDRVPVQSTGRKEDELEKRLTGAMLSGQAIISIDNVNGDLGGDFLCQMIERPRVQVRPLGGSGLVEIESRACTFATGNNIRLVGDMTRRVILCSLDPQMERPELREFKTDPFALVTADRGKYIAAALTICRAYAGAGYPGTLSPLASFEQWSRTVRSALVWLDCPDPVETMLKARAEDPVTGALGSLLAAWHDAFGDQPVTTGRVKDMANERHPSGHLAYEALHESLAAVATDRRGAVCSVALGRACGRHKGRIVNGLRLIDGGVDTHSKQKLWAVSRS